MNDERGLDESYDPHARVASERGWSYEPSPREFKPPLYPGAGPWGYVDRLFRGVWDGMDFLQFDYRYVYSAQTGVGEALYSCATTSIPADCPPTRIERETKGDRLARHFGVHDVETGSREFDQIFLVKSDDPAFAHLLLGEAMQTWLLYFEPMDYWFQLGGAWIMVYRPPVDPEHMESLLTVLKGFRDRIPPAVFAR
jgi:hypothetical protein